MPPSLQPTYELLSHLYLHGVTADILPKVRAIPELVAHIPAPFDPDEAAADHYHLFGFNVFPYENIFLDPTGLLGGPVANEVLSSYREVGFGAEDGLDLSAESPDHLGNELLCLAFLLRVEEALLANGQKNEAGELARYQRRFLEKHLLCWLPPVVLAIEEQNQPFYAALARITLEAAKGHWRSRLVAGSPVTQFSLPGSPDLLKENKTGLKDISEFLLAPVSSGLYISRDTITRLARELACPRGFGGRQQMMVNLMRSAAEYDRIGELFNLLAGLAGRWATAYGEMTSAEESFPFAAVWRSQVLDAGALLEHMVAQVSDNQ